MEKIIKKVTTEVQGYGINHVHYEHNFVHIEDENGIQPEMDICKDDIIYQAIASDASKGYNPGNLISAPCKVISIIKRHEDDDDDEAYLKLIVVGGCHAGEEINIGALNAYHQAQRIAYISKVYGEDKIYEQLNSL